MANDVKLLLYDAETGELDGNLTTNTKYDKDNSIMLCSDYEMTFNCNEIPTTSFDELFGINKDTKPDAYDVTYIKIVQCRKNKNKRINKKWIKKYGYRQVNVITKGWELNTYTDGTFEFKKNKI